MQYSNVDETYSATKLHAKDHMLDWNGKNRIVKLNYLNIASNAFFKCTGFAKQIRIRNTSSTKFKI